MAGIYEVAEFRRFLEGYAPDTIVGDVTKADTNPLTVWLRIKTDNPLTWVVFTYIAQIEGGAGREEAAPDWMMAFEYLVTRLADRDVTARMCLDTLDGAMRGR